MLAAVFFGAAAVMVVEGVQLRRWASMQLEPIRFRGDIQRGFRYGRRATLEGYLDLYDRYLAETRDRYRELDYAPLRLMIMRTWAAQTLEAFPDAETWRHGHAFTAPALRINTAIELFGAVGVFLLVRLWVVRARARFGGEDDEPPLGRRAVWREAVRPMRGWGLGLIGAGLLWFNPAAILSSHGWPTWDIWIVPFYVWAILMVSINRWYTAGVFIGLGALLKGQQLIVAPVFIMTALFMGRPGAAARWVIGWATAVAAVVSGWMLTYPMDLSQVWVAKGDFAPLRDADAPLINFGAVMWVFAVAAIAGVVAAAGVMRTRWSWRTRAGVLAGAAAALIAVWLIASAGGGAVWAVLAAGALAACGWWLPGRAQGYVVSAALAGALFMCIPLFDASTGWFIVGWKYGSHHWEYLIMGLTSNVPGVLTRHYGWKNTRDLVAPLFEVWGVTVTLKIILAAVYFVVLTLCAIGAARHLRAKDPRFLVAMVTPWLAMFTILGQIHERYLLFAAGIGMCLIAVSWGFVALQLMLSFFALIMPLQVMVGRRGRRWREVEGYEGSITRETAEQWYAWIAPTHPDIAWAIVVCLLVYLYVTLCPPRRCVTGRLDDNAAQPAPETPTPGDEDENRHRV